MYDVIIIGGGCAGLTAAIYTTRANLKTLLFANDYDNKGGLLVKTSLVENYPGFAEGVMGYDLMVSMETQAKNFGAEIKNEKILEVGKNDSYAKPLFTVLSDSGSEYCTWSLIMATGSTPNKLGLKNEDQYWGRGISSCAVCDGALYKNKKIVVVGGGDSAMEEANFLTKFSDVTLIHRRDEFRASKTMQNKVFNNPKIKLMLSTTVDKLVGHDSKLTSIICTHLPTQQQFTLPVDGLFYGLGLTPNSALVSNLVELQNGYVARYPLSEMETATSQLGIFAAGDVSDHIYRQAIVACGDGCKAAMDVEKYLNSF